MQPGIDFLRAGFLKKGVQAPVYRFRRSLTFWLGLFGVAFILSLWVDSVYHWSSISWSKGRITTSLDNGESSLFFYHGRVAGMRAGGRVGASRSAITAAGKGPPLDFIPRPLAGRRRIGAADGVFLDLPHWLLLFLYLCAWYGCMLLRRLQVRRARAAMAELPR